MRKFFITVAVLGLVAVFSTSVFCEEKEQPVQFEGYGRGWGDRPRMGYGWDPGHMMDYGYSRGPDYSMPGPLHSLKPEDRKKWEKLWAHYLTETMEIRKQIAVKRIELETLWAQPNVDRAKVEKLSSELSELYTKRTKACDNYVISVREQFGKLGWACPIGQW
jgi:hypothetical protein